MIRNFSECTEHVLKKCKERKENDRIVYVWPVTNATTYDSHKAAVMLETVPKDSQEVVQI